MKTCLARFLLRWSLLSLLAFLPFLATAQTNFQILKSFGFRDLDLGSGPYNNPIVSSNGFIYGTAFYGGYYGNGIIYRLATNGSSYQILHSFSGYPSDGEQPAGSLLLASDGLLYGATTVGGTHNTGVIFKMNLDGSGYRILFCFDLVAGAAPTSGLIEGKNDGYLYGATSIGGDFDTGTVFKISKNGTNIQTLLSLNTLADYNSATWLTEGSDGYIYAVSQAGSDGNGSVLKFDHSGQNLSTLYHFGTFASDGLLPLSPLYYGNDGFLYGTTSSGGNENFGTLFKLSTNGVTTTTVTNVVSTNGNTTVTVATSISGYQQLHLFSIYQDGSYPAAGLTQGPGGDLYGITGYGNLFGNQGGTVFKVDSSGQNFSAVISFSTDVGSYCQQSLAIDPIGNFYAVTYFGGTANAGTLITFNTNATNALVLHNFAQRGGGDGIIPFAAPIILAGTAFGTTGFGGTNLGGTIFKINVDGTAYTNLHYFGGTNDPSVPNAPLIQAADGMLYGTTVGSIYRLDTNGGNYSKLHIFSYGQSDGSICESALVQGQDGFLYGSTTAGGSNQAGTIFKILTHGNGYQILHSFQPIEGMAPQTLTLGPDQFLYGVTTSGGISNNGTVFKIKTDGSSFSNLYNFSGFPLDGSKPTSPLLLGRDGLLYGVLANGGSNLYYGALYKVDTNGGNFRVFYSFDYDATSLFYPSGSLAQRTNGLLYGITGSGGLNNRGALYSIDTNGNNLSIICSFPYLSGYQLSAPVLADDGAYYGTFESGGDSNEGAIYKITAHPEVTIISLQYQPGSVILTFSGGISGQYYAILSSSTPSGPWREIGTAAADANGNFQFTDTTSSGHTARYYRSYGP